MKHIRIKLIPGVFTSLLLLATCFTASADVNTIQIEIISAPVVPNGIVASEPTEINILVRKDGTPAASTLDPEVFGLQIPVGGRMDVVLGGSFVPNPDFGTHFPGRNIILTTGPQNPIKPNDEDVSGGFWRVETPVANTVTVIPRGGVDDNGLAGTRAAAIGFKVIHIRPDTRNRSHSGTPFYNGAAGTIGSVEVSIYDSANVLQAAGMAEIVFPESAGRQANLSNLNTRDDNSINSNTQFQRVAKNTELHATSLPASGTFTDGGPYAPQFLLFDDFGSHDPDQYPTGSTLPDVGDASYIPFPGISNLTVENTSQNTVANLMQGDTQIGVIVMSGPAYGEDGKKNSSFHLIGGEATITQLGNGTLLFVPVKVGRVAGAYTVTVQMLNGGVASNTIIVDD